MKKIYNKIDSFFGSSKTDKATVIFTVATVIYFIIYFAYGLFKA